MQICDSTFPILKEVVLGFLTRFSSLRIANPILTDTLSLSRTGFV